MPRRVSATTFVSTLSSNVAARPDFVSCGLEDIRMPAVQLARKVWGVPLACWTIRSPEELAACDSMGVPAIFEGFMPDAPTRE